MVVSAIVGIVSTWCMLLMLDAIVCLKQRGARVCGLGDVAAAAMGPRGRYLIDGVVVTTQMGVCTAYCVFLAENIQAFVFERYGGMVGKKADGEECGLTGKSYWSVCSPLCCSMCTCSAMCCSISAPRTAVEHHWVTPGVPHVSGGGLRVGGQCVQCVVLLICTRNVVWCICGCKCCCVACAVWCAAVSIGAVRRLLSVTCMVLMVAAMLQDFGEIRIWCTTQ